MTEMSKDIKGFLIALGAVIILAAVFYVITGKFVTKELFNEKEEENIVEIDYDNTIIGSMFNKPYNEYYVIIFDSSSEDSATYQTIVSDYYSLENKPKLYFADLNIYINQKYLFDKSNPSASNINEIKVTDFTLIKIKDNKITKYIEDYSKAKEELLG